MSYVRADETPHVDYLRTALTEMRDRTFVGASGGKIAGTEVIGTLWDTALAQSLGPNRENFVKTADAELEHALASNPRRRDPRGLPLATQVYLREEPGADPEART